MREAILSAIREAAKENGGRTSGSKAFFSDSGFKLNDLWKAGFSDYSSAVIAAGLEPNKMQSAIDQSEALMPLANVVQKIGKFPSKGELMAARSSEPGMPNFNTYVRMAGGSYLKVPALLLKYCKELPEFSEIVVILERSKKVLGADAGAAKKSPADEYVYLARHGNDFKIGRTNDVARRRREVALLLPQELIQVHVITTDDPEGIEQYWHRRFASRRVRGEWFRLNAKDVAAFKRRRFQ